MKMKLGHLTLNFRIKVLLFVAVMMLVPMLVLSFYYYGSLRTEILEDIDEEVRFEDRLFSYMVSDSQIFFITEIAYDLRIKQDILESQAALISNALNKVGRFNNSTLLELVRSCMFKSVNNDIIRFFIYDKSSQHKHYFLDQEDRKLLNSLNRLKTKTMHDYLDGANFTPDVFTHYFFSYEELPFLVGVYPISEDQLIVAVENLSEELEKYQTASVNDIIKNIDLFLSALQYLDSNLTFTLIDNKSRILLSNQNSFDLLFPNQVLSDAKDKNYWSGSLMHKSQIAISTISYFPSLDWYIAVLKYPQEELNVLIHNLLNVLFLSIWVALCGILAIALILRQPFGRLNIIADAAKLIENAGLKNADRLAQISDKIPAQKCGYPDIDQLVMAFKKMTSSLSANVQNIIDLTNKQKRVEGELNAAHNIQAGMLPDHLTFPAFAPFELCPCLLPAKEVGGDLYDAIPLDDDNFAVVIGGVSEKGVPAALFMTMTITLVRQGLSMQLKPAALMNEINKALCLHNPNMMHVTLFISMINKVSRTITYANGGHCKPLICSARGIRTLEQISGPAPGVMEGRQYLEYTDTLAEDETLLLYTNGLSKAQNEQKEMFGLTRILKLFEQNYEQSAQELVQSFTKGVRDFRGQATQSEDLTLVVVKNKG